MTTFAVREGRDQAHHLPAPSPSSNTFTDSALGSDMMDNKKGHLLRRWNQMLSCIARTSLEDRAVTAMHKHLDEVENLISWDIMDENRRVDETDGLGISGLSTEDSVYFEENITPAASIAPDAPERMCRSGWMEETSVEAQALLLRVTEAANQLRCRQGEFQHLHDIAITKAEAGAQRIMQLESEVEQLEEDSSNDQSEFTFLKLKLRMLEIQAAPYIPKGNDDGLSEGIRKWKLDWADVDQGRRARRRKKNIS